MKTPILPTLLLSCICLITFAQVPSKSRKEIQGDKYAFVYSFDKAITSFKASKTLTIEGKRQLAKSYYNLDRFKEAELAYADLLKDTAGITSNDYYNYSMSLKANAKYAESDLWMDKFKTAKPYDAMTKSYSANKLDLAYLLKDDGKYKIEHLNINSNAEDFGTSFYKDKIIFSSSRVKTPNNDKKYNWNGKPFLDVYMATVDGAQLTTPEAFNPKMNTKLHDGTVSFNKDGTLMAFTSNVVTTNKKELIIGLQIFFSSYVDSMWTAPVSFTYNSKDYSVGQPCLSADGKTMYFTSDMPGGFGGADIYRTKKDNNGDWKKPENLGNKINTERDDMFPFFEEKNEILFFTSNGHYGLGGLDIFMVATSGTRFGKVYNAGIPLNSQYDDFAVIVDSKTEKGYFSSDRVGGSGDDDIYTVDFLKGLNAGNKIYGKAIDKDSLAVPNTFVSLTDVKGMMIDSVTTDSSASYFFFVDSYKNFVLSGKKINYLDGKTESNSFGKDFAVRADILMLEPPKKAEIIAKQIVIGADLGKILELKPIYFDVNKYNIRPDAEIELDKIVTIMNEYPNMIIELGSHTDCRNTKAYNQKLSDRRAKASAAYVQRGITSTGRVFGKGYGETRLVNGCACEKKVVSKCTEEEHQQNRRTEFIILKK